MPEAYFIVCPDCATSYDKWQSPSCPQCAVLHSLAATPRTPAPMPAPEIKTETVPAVTDRIVPYRTTGPNPRARRSVAVESVPILRRRLSDRSNVHPSFLAMTFAAGLLAYPTVANLAMGRELIGLPVIERERPAEIVRVVGIAPPAPQVAVRPANLTNMSNLEMLGWDQQTSVEGDRIRFMGTVRNTGASELRDVAIQALGQDETGNTLARTWSSLETGPLAPGAVGTFSLELEHTAGVAQIVFSSSWSDTSRSDLLVIDTGDARPRPEHASSHGTV